MIFPLAALPHLKVPQLAQVVKATDAVVGERQRDQGSAARELGSGERLQSVPRRVDDSNVLQVAKGAPETRDALGRQAELEKCNPCAVKRRPSLRKPLGNLLS